MTDFQYKTLRCEWQIRFVDVDQYGVEEGTYKRIPFPTREEALAHLPEVAEESPYVKGRWHPKGYDSTYSIAKVSYHEVEV